MLNESSPKLLYHGSMYRHDVLKPAFQITGELREWDEGQSNEWLYATPDINLAIEMGLASAVEQKWIVNRFHTDGPEITIELDVRSPPLSQHMLHRITVTLYTITFKLMDGWERVDNDEVNEWRTKRAVSSIRARRIISMYEWLMDRSVIVRHPRFRSM